MRQEGGEGREGGEEGEGVAGCETVRRGKERGGRGGEGREGGEEEGIVQVRVECSCMDIALVGRGYSLFAYSRFAYFRQKSGISPTRKKQLYVTF